MFDLPLREMIVFSAAAAAYFAAAVMGVLQLGAVCRRCKRFLVPLVALAAVLEAVMLIFRAVEIKAIPLTGTFESLIVLTIVFALVYLFLSIAIQHIWFGSMMVWVIFGVFALSAIIAEPASAALHVASTPWAIAHAIAMILGGASLMLATATAALYLFSRKKLKQKKVLAVLGRVPNIQKLEQMNIFGLKASFVLMTFGLTTGLGLSFSLRLGPRDWITDSKTVLIAGVWILLGLTLLLWRTGKLREKTIATATIIASALILFAAVGTLMFCGTWHDFSSAARHLTEITGNIVT
ncbi:MAG: cytochrome c biogenesis protein CcsA [Planctomycetota bacterium]|jgi:ABC-type uncharacterized transport system permease subunit